MKEAAQGTRSLKALLSNLESIGSVDKEISPAPKAPAILPDGLPPAPKAFDAGWEISAAHNEAAASATVLSKDCDKAGNISKQTRVVDIMKQHHINP